MAKKSNTKRNKKKQIDINVTSKIIAAVIIVLVFFALFLNQGILGSAIGDTYRFLFGKSYKLISCFIIFFCVYIIFRPQFVTKSYLISTSLAVLSFIWIATFFWQMQNPDMNLFTSISTQIKEGENLTGYMGYLLSWPIYFLFSDRGLFVFGVILAIIAFLFMIDIKSIIDKFSDIRKKQQAKKIEKEKLAKEKRLQELVKEAQNETISEAIVDESEPNKNLPSQKNEQDDNKLGEVVINQEVLEPSKTIKPLIVGDYKVPELSLLNDYQSDGAEIDKIRKKAQAKANVLIETLDMFNLKARISNITVGPSITKFELIPDNGVKISRFNSLHNDLAFALAAKNVRIEAPIPGKSAIGIEIPNDENKMVGLKEVLLSKNNNFAKKLQIGLGKDIDGKAIFCEIDKTPHLLVAGSTGSGKSVCINSIIISLLTKASPDEVKLVMIDPKKVELTPYNGIPHLLAPVVTDAKKASVVLQKMVKEMERRYELFAQTNTRNIIGYNKQAPEEEKLPYIVIIVDELADLMMVASKEVETAIARLAQMARAAGMHLIIATQRPSTDVITGLIKANIPSRIAFAVSSGIDSRTILDQSGAEQLLGRGDMLLSEQSETGLKRVQGAFLSDEEILKVVEAIKSQFSGSEVEESYDQTLVNIESEALDEELDPLFEEVREYVINTQKASASLLQRQFKIGYNRALRILDQLEAAGIISANEGTKPRRVLINEEDYDKDI